jgi:hypothetical protein
MSDIISIPITITSNVNKVECIIYNAIKQASMHMVHDTLHDYKPSLFSSTGPVPGNL